MSSDPRREDSWQALIEVVFERWGRFVYRRRWPALVLSVLVTGWLVSYLPGLTIDNSTEGLLLPDDPSVIAYNAFRDQFGRDDALILAVESEDIFSLGFLERLRALHRAIEAEVPHVEDVDSLINARVTRGEDGALVVGELLEDWPTSEVEVARIERFVMTNPLYLDNFISSDGAMTAILVKPSTYSALAATEATLEGFDSDAGAEEGDREEAPVYLTAAEGDALVNGVARLIERFDAPDFRLHQAGAIVMTHRINLGMTRDFMIFLPATLVLMSLVLAVLFRRIGGVLLPLMVVVLSLVATLGVMIVLGIPGSTAVQILPVFLLTVGVCDAVHILAIVYRLRMEGADKEDAVAWALGHAGLAILMTSVTTAAGMVSFVTAEMAAVKHLGTLAPIGVAIAFVYTMVLLPALLAIFPLPVPRTGRIARGVFPFEGFLVEAGSFATRQPWRILLPTSLLLALAILGALQTRFSHNGLTWFPQDDRVVTDFRAIDAGLGGSISLDIVIDTGQPGGLYEPAVLHAIEGLERDVTNLASDPIVIGKAMSIVDIVEETHQALNEGRPEMRRIPETREAIAQELLLFENSGSDDTEELVDSDFQTARVTLRVPFVDALAFPPFLDRLRPMIADRFGPGVEFQLTGIMTLLAEIFEAVIWSMGRSYVFAIGVITPLMMLLLGSLRRGLVSMIPNLLPILAVLGVMGWLAIPLDSTTMLIGAMVIGIAVDDTIHFMHKFHRYFEETGDLELAVRETLRTTGSALLFTTLVLAAGFAIFGFSEMTNIRIFGLLSAFAAVVAFAADLLVAPALLAVVEGHRQRRAQAAGASESPDPG